MLDVPLKDITLKPNILIASISRGGKTIIPGGRDVISEGDRVIIVTTNRRFDDLSEILQRGHMI